MSLPEFLYLLCFLLLLPNYSGIHYNGTSVWAHTRGALATGRSVGRSGNGGVHGILIYTLFGLKTNPAVFFVYSGLFVTE